MLVSTFELLLKPQIPLTIPGLPPAAAAASRTVLQGYFLTIANVTNSNVRISLEFTAFTPPLDIGKTFTFFDVSNNNDQGDLVSSGAAKSKIELNLLANDTGLFILQPDITGSNASLLTTADFEVRGFVDISLISPGSAELLLTPEQRGTFFKDLTALDPQLDQVIYNLPTANGGSLYVLD